MLESTFIILTTDHGATGGTLVHGEQNNQNLLIPLVAWGPNIRKGYEMRGNVHLMDVAPTILKMMGLEKEETWRGKVIEEIWEQDEAVFLRKWEM